MTTYPGDRTAAAAGAPDHGHFRASHADRARVTDVLRGAFGEGRLTRDELDARIGQASAARTYAELGTLTADLPAGQAGTWPLRGAAGAQTRTAAAQTGACVIVFAASVLTVLLLARPMSALAFTAALGAAATIVVASILTAALMLESRHQPRSDGPPPRSQPAAPPPQPAADGGGPPPDRPADDFPQVD